jgi:hypothetical protein
MKLADIKKIDRSKLPNEDFKTLYDEIKEGTGGFDEEFIELFESEIEEFLTAVKKYVPEALTETVKKVRQPRKKTEKPIDFEDDDVVETVMDDYNLTREKAVKLIALRKEAYELKKENIDKLLDRLDKSEFYQGKNSKAPIDRNRTRDLGKDSKQSSITLAEERKMTGRPFKRISKAGRKNQYGTTEGGKVYYEYRMNRRDVDKKIKLEKGGGVRSEKLVGIYKTKSEAEKMKTSFENAYSTKNSEHELSYYIKPSSTKGSVLKYDLFEVKGKLKLEKGGGVDMFVSYAPDPNSWLPNENTNNKKYRVDLTFVDKITKKKSETTVVVISKNVQQAKENAIFDIETDFPMAQQIKVVKTQIQLKTGGGVGIPNADKMFHLPYELAVYVPSTKDVDKNITATELRARVKEVEKYLAETFGGFTSAEKVGGYLSSKSSVVTEKVIPVTSFASMLSFKENKYKLVNKMSVWAKKWGQEAIGFEFEGDLYYVPQKFKTGGKLKATYIPKRDIKSLTTIWGNNIQGKDLIDGAYTKRKNIKSAPKVTRGFVDDEAYEYKTGGEAGTKTLQDPKKLYNLLNQAEANWSKDDGAEYNRIFALIKENRKNYYNLLNQAEANWSKDGGAEYNRLLELQKDYYAKGGKAPEPTVVRGFYDDEPYEYAKGGKSKPKDPVIVRGFYDDEPYEYAEGGLLEHGLQVGDVITNFDKNTDTIQVKNDGIIYNVHLPTGTRRTSFSVKK